VLFIGGMVVTPNFLSSSTINAASFSQGIYHSFYIDDFFDQFLDKNSYIFNGEHNLLIIVFLATLMVLFFAIREKLVAKKIILWQGHIKQKLLNNPDSHLFNYLIIIFAKGLLHSKIY
jgi:hypothetical protein